MRYRIKPGHTFRDSDNSVKAGGDEIELSDEAAQQHADKVEPVSVLPAAVHTSEQRDE